MPDRWLPNAEIIGCTKTGGSYNGAPYRLTLHTTEGDPGTVNGCRNMAETHGSPPQLWYHPRLRWLGQGLPLDRSAYALAHPSGTPETNRAGALQVEMFGYADDTPNWTTELDNIGHDVLRPLLDAGWPIDTGRLAPTTGSDGYGQNGAVRGNWDQWANFNGLCVHANVPGNDHWDAGQVDLHRIVDAAGGVKPKPPPPEERDMAAPATCTDSDDRQWVFYKGTDKQLWARCGSDEPFALGGEVTDAITVVPGPRLQFDVYAYAPNGSCWSRHAEGYDWGDWYQL